MDILITGGTGSFGNAFVKRLLSENEYGRICIYSRDEYKQFLMKQSIPDPDGRLRFFIGDVRDKDRLKRALCGIDVVVHAAALKRIEVGNYNPDEMIKTNVMGTMNVIDAAHEAGTEKLVFLSTDKAYQPISPYGQSKALAESLILNNFYGEYGPAMSVTRYGNVCGSTGSVIPIWREQLKYSDTVTVTDPYATRFWMLMSEAVDLVKNTIDTMPEEVVIPELPAFSVGDLAKAMGAKTQNIGLPKYEKTHECMAFGHCSNTARRMSVEEIEEGLKYV